MIFRNYILVYFLFALGGVTTFSSNSRFVQLFAVVLVLLFFYKKKRIDKEIVFISIYITVLFIAQYLKFNAFNLKNYIVLIYTILIPYIIIKIVGRDFTTYYINITVLFAIISFFFLIPAYLFPKFNVFIQNLAIQLDLDPLEGVHENFIVYNYQEMRDGLIKNPGPFYEAGAFGSFLVIALILSLIKTRSLFNFKNIILIITILSTFSTAAYIALFAIVLFYYTNSKKLWKPIILIPFILFISYQAFSEFSFLQQKIQTQLEQSSRLDESDIRVGRFHSAKLDMIDIMKYPITGRGLIAETRFDNIYEVGSNNGLTDLAVRYGIFGFLLYFILIYKSLTIFCRFNHFNPRFAFFSLIPLAIMLFAQVIYSKPAFLALMMMFILYKGVTPFKSKQ
ncbi:MAG: O-antigen ligase family protein [Candidatus Odinarchaeota archaeon]